MKDLKRMSQRPQNFQAPPKHCGGSMVFNAEIPRCAIPKIFISAIVFSI